MLRGEKVKKKKGLTHRLGKAFAESKLPFKRQAVCNIKEVEHIIT